MKKNRLVLAIVFIAVILFSMCLVGCKQYEEITLEIKGKDSTFYGVYKIPKYNKDELKNLQQGYQIANLASINSSLYSDLTSFISSETKQPVDSKITVDKENNGFSYSVSQKGYKIDEEKLYNNIISSLPSKNITLTADYVDISPTITEQDNKNNTVFRGSFTTNFHSSSEGRKSNIKLSSTSINGTVINPKEKFSFNEVVGCRTKERGYKKAKIIVNGKFVEGVGGGVCQVSTTLYNAMLLAGLNIVKASQHSLPVSYVKPSFDAMVSSSSDLVVENNTDHPIYIFSKCDDSNVTFTVYGEKLEYDIVAKSKVTEIVPYDVEYSSDEVKNGKNGIKSHLKLIYYKEGKKIYEKIVRQDFYRPQNEIRLVED